MPRHQGGRGALPGSGGAPQRLRLPPTASGSGWSRPHHHHHHYHHAVTSVLPPLGRRHPYRRHNHHSPPPTPHHAPTVRRLHSCIPFSLLSTSLTLPRLFSSYQDCLACPPLTPTAWHAWLPPPPPPPHPPPLLLPLPSAVGCKQAGRQEAACPVWLPTASGWHCRRGVDGGVASLPFLRGRSLSSEGRVAPCSASVHAGTAAPSPPPWFLGRIGTFSSLFLCRL